MLKEYFVVRVYNADGSLACEIESSEFPDEGSVESAILNKSAVDGFAEVVKRYRPIVPFA